MYRSSCTDFLNCPGEAAKEEMLTLPSLAKLPKHSRERTLFSSAQCGLHQCNADTGADTWKKQALYHMPGLLTLAEQVQISSTRQSAEKHLYCEQVISFAQRLKSMATPVKS